MTQEQQAERKQQAGWWPDLLNEWTGPLMVAEPGNYGDPMPDDRFPTCHRWIATTNWFGQDPIKTPVLSLSKYDINIIHGQPGSGKSATVQALLYDLCRADQDKPGLTASVLTATNLTRTTWTNRMADQELAGRPANIYIHGGINIWTDAGLLLLMDDLTERKPDILVLDCLNDILPPGQPAEHHTWTALFQNLEIVSRRAEQQTGKDIVLIGIVQETGNQSLLNKGDYAEWGQTGLTLRVISSADIPSVDHNADAYCVLYPTAGGKNRYDIPVMPVSIHQLIYDVRAKPAGNILKLVKYYDYGDIIMSRNLTDIPGLKPKRNRQTY